MGATTSSDDKIEEHNLQFGDKLGEGGFGTVRHVTFKVPHRGFYEGAAKTVIFDLGVKEVEIMNKLNHKHVVSLLGWCRTPFADVIVMEKAPHGSLLAYLKDQSKSLTYDLQKKWVRETAFGIQYLHRLNVLHRDIKPGNCLLFEDNLLKLCDFGIAREIDSSQTSSTQKGTHRYMAPELHRGNARGKAVFSKPSDIYAYGMLVLEICTRQPPFEGWEWHKIIFHVGNGVKPTIPGDCPEDLADIIRQCWHTEPKQRSTIGAIIIGGWF